MVNQAKDLVERVAWSFLGTLAGLVVADNVFGSFNIDALHKLESATLAAAVITVKVFVAQRVGRHNDGAAIPGGVITLP